MLLTNRMKGALKFRDPCWVLKPEVEDEVVLCNTGNRDKKAE